MVRTRQTDELLEILEKQFLSFRLGLGLGPSIEWIQVGHSLNSTSQTEKSLA